MMRNNIYFEYLIKFKVNERTYLPFFLEQVEGKSFSSILTRDLLHFILQKKERLDPEHNLEGLGAMSVLTRSPAEKIMLCQIILKTGEMHVVKGWNTLLNF